MRTERSEEGGERARRLGRERAGPVGDGVLGANQRAGVIAGRPQVKGVGAPAVGQVPALGQAGRGPERGVQPGQALEQLAADGERGRIVDQRRVQSLRVLGLHQPQADRDGRWPAAR